MKSILKVIPHSSLVTGLDRIACLSGKRTSKKIQFVLIVAVSLVTTLKASHAQISTENDVDSVPLRKFLEKFDPISERGYIRTMRAGDSGIGYTLESLLEIEENNSPRGDFLGMEIKAYRDHETEFDDQGKMNIFLKEPQWTDGLTNRQRLQQYGYQDPNGRRAWYLSVTGKVNKSGLQLQVSDSRDALLLLRNDQVIGSWSMDVLETRLKEKHSESVFVAASVRGQGADEEFWYRTVTWCRDPSAARLMELVETGDVIVELRMHLRPDGSVRNHGTEFRVRKHKLQYLFRVQQRMRPIVD